MAYSGELTQPSFYKSGVLVLGAVVFLVNLQIALQSNIFDYFGVFLLSGSVLIYFFIYYIMNLEVYKSDDLLGTFSHAMGDPITYFGFIFCGGSLCLMD